MQRRGTDRHGICVLLNFCTKATQILQNHAVALPGLRLQARDSHRPRERAAASQKAAFDQSPSARTAPGERYRCPPGMAQPSGSGSVAMPKRRSAASVMAI